MHATSFVIASPAARAILDRTCMVGRGWWADEWWPEAAREGLVAIESHSWDHNHDTLPETAQREQVKGTFRSIDTHGDADAEIRAAADFIDAHCAPHRSTLFAYPYGESNDYLVRGVPAALRARAPRARGVLDRSRRRSRRIRIAGCLPRYVCGRDWRDPAELQSLLSR